MNQITKHLKTCVRSANYQTLILLYDRSDRLSIPVQEGCGWIISEGGELGSKWIVDATVTSGYDNLNDCPEMKMKRMSMTSPSMKTSQMPVLKTYHYKQVTYKNLKNNSQVSRQ